MLMVCLLPYVLGCMATDVGLPRRCLWPRCRRSAAGMYELAHASGLYVAEVIATPNLIVVSNSVLLLCSSAALVAFHVLGDLLLVLMTVVLGCLFVANQATELSSPSCLGLLAVSTHSLLCVQVHASHLLLGCGAISLWLVSEMSHISTTCSLMLLLSNY
jgi:heme/copper-type cytochrome/quinol oxidase subunit 3